MEPSDLLDLDSNEAEKESKNAMFLLSGFSGEILYCSFKV